MVSLLVSLVGFPQRPSLTIHPCGVAVAPCFAAGSRAPDTLPGSGSTTGSRPTAASWRTTKKATVPGLKGHGRPGRELVRRAQVLEGYPRPGDLTARTERVRV